MNRHFELLSNRFALGSMLDLDEYRGAVVASENAIFFVFNAEKGFNRKLAEFQKTVAAHGQGLLNTNNSAESSDHVTHCTYDQLPDDIIQDKSWPITFRAGRVIVIPKEQIIKLRWSRLSGLKIHVKDAIYTCTIGIFGFRKAKSKLSNLDWVV